MEFTNAMIAKLFVRTQQSEKSLFEEVGDNGQFAYRDAGSKVLAVAHCDYVDRDSNHFYYDYPEVHCSRLDDRLGVHAILDWLPLMGINVDVLLTTDEEIGRSTAQYFKGIKPYNWIFQFDRRGTDAVTYHYDEMDEYAAQHFKVGYGSFSDICWLDLGVCGLNVGTGYYNEHTLGSYCDLRDFAEQLKKFRRFYDDFKDTCIPHDSSTDYKGYNTNSYNVKVTHYYDQSSHVTDCDCFHCLYDGNNMGFSHRSKYLAHDDYIVADDYARDLGYDGMNDYMSQTGIWDEYEAYSALEAHCLENIS